MLYDTVLSGKGIFELERVLEFFRKMKIPVDQITVEGDQFDFKSNFDDLYDLYAYDYEYDIDEVERTHSLIITFYNY